MKGNWLILFHFALLVAIGVTQETDDEVTIETADDGKLSVPYESPQPLDPSKVYFSEHFDDSTKFDRKWVKSQTKKEGFDDEIAKYDGVWSVEGPQRDGLKGDLGLALKSKAKHAAIAAPFLKPFIFDKKPLIVQYEVFLQDGQECGGAYLKLLSQNEQVKNLENFHDKTPYTIMFGPDKCGNDHKLHFIFRHKNPKNGTIEEKHCQKPKERLEEIFSDKLPHLYTLIINPDNTFVIQVDKKILNSGSLLEDFTPPVNPPAEIDDPDDKKPDDWDERERIHDPNAVKPEDWDEDAPSKIVDESATIPEGWLEDVPALIPNPDDKKPDDWDKEMDGEWEPALIENPLCANAPGCGPWEQPLIDNPEYKGKWRAPLIENPNYKGKWRPRKIPNPHYFEDKEPFKMQPISAVGFELWSMSKDILFDNLIITEQMEIAEHWASATFDKKRQKIAQDSVSLSGRIMKSLNYNLKGWSLYFIYCLIPVGFYIRYLYKCVTEESVMQKLINTTHQYPILWGVYAVILSLPVVLIFYFLCKGGKSNTKEDEAEITKKKKTDGVTEDVNDGDADDDDDEDEKDEESNAKITEVENLEEKQNEKDPEKESGSESSSDQDEKAEDDKDKTKTPENQTAAGGGEGITRKRKVRRE